ncbi:NACHT domain-containing protein [Streptomyces sp. NPDC001093]|uniref:NACHT domain-containing protein n=1 Tax=Streptomyces sp. NPDC001093 TaxID=3154376 RepID=UPI00331B6576
MSEKTGRSAGRQALREALRDLEKTALEKTGRSRAEAIAEANRRLVEAGLPERGTTTVGGWFEAGSPAKDFLSLWAVVQVLHEWSGKQSPDTRSGPERARATAWWKGTEELWKKRWEQAKETRPPTASPANAPLITAYLTAAREVARRHPHPGVPGAGNLPPLDNVRVPRGARIPAADRQTSSGPGTAGAGGDQPGAEVPATEVFGHDRPICVLLGSPGGGKSTLLRTYLADVADSWLNGRTGKTIPVMVSAAALGGTDPLPTALAKAVTGELRQVGLLEELGADFFRCPPRAGGSWLVLVDGLDEIPDADTRSAVVTMLAGAAAAGTGLYRFVVATRPLPPAELDALGGQAPRYELQPFTTDDLRTYVEKYFSSRWPQQEATRRAHQFTGALRDASLAELARTPLMVFMLCQLHLAKPERPLPDGRTAAYKEFTDLLYETNASKHVADSHEKAIKHLVESLQSPRARKEADAAARHVHERLLELIDYLAYRRLSDHATSVAEALASHEAVRRPGKVRPERWEAFLENLLRHTGLLVHRADGLGFPHQTFLEYHAARHATRNEAARAELLDELFPAGHGPQVPTTEPSYLGFLLDGLVVPSDGLAAEVAERVEDLTAHGGPGACSFLTAQVRLRTNLPPASTARQLTRFIKDITLPGIWRVEAAKMLAGMEDYQHDGAVALKDLAQEAHDTTPFGPVLDIYRVEAAYALARVEGHRHDGAAALKALARDTTLNRERLVAATALAGLEGHRRDGAVALLLLAQDTTLNDPVLGIYRVEAAQVLAGMDEYRRDGATALLQLVLDTALNPERLVAARALTGTEGHRHDGAAALLHLTQDTTLLGLARVEAAEVLAGMEDYRHHGAAALIELVGDTTLNDNCRVRAEWALGRVEGYEWTRPEPSPSSPGNGLQENRPASHDP